MDRLTGMVKWFDNTKGFGFIESGNKDYFVHFRAIKNMGFKTLTEGQKVTFEPKKTDKGLTADAVTVGVEDGNS